MSYGKSTDGSVCQSNLFVNRFHFVKYVPTHFFFFLKEKLFGKQCKTVE